MQVFSHFPLSFHSAVAAVTTPTIQLDSAHRPTAGVGSGGLISRVRQ